MSQFKYYQSISVSIGNEFKTIIIEPGIPKEGYPVESLFDYFSIMFYTNLIPLELDYRQEKIWQRVDLLCLSQIW